MGLDFSVLSSHSLNFCSHRACGCSKEVDMWHNRTSAVWSVWRWHCMQVKLLVGRAQPLHQANHQPAQTGCTHVMLPWWIQGRSRVDPSTLVIVCTCRWG